MYRSGPSFFDGLIVLTLGVANAQTIVAEGFLVKQDVFFFSFWVERQTQNNLFIGDNTIKIVLLFCLMTNFTLLTLSPP